MAVPFRNELALVTGGAIRLGREIALGLAQEGYGIALHYRSSAVKAKQTAQQIASYGVPCTLIQADLRDPAQITLVFDQISRLELPFRVLVNSASAMPRGNLQDLSVAEWDDTLNLNLRAPWLCAQAAARLMEADGGVIINLSDTGARKTWTGFPAYTISKAGLEVLTRLLARTLSPKIRVNAVAPGLILPSDQTDSADWKKLVAKLPVQQPGSPQDAVQAVLFLIHHRYITGETLIVDGGYHLV
ncbi:MAG TPA: SDR family oxidoreductase [Bellilinea sp.]|nr:SDR family oxidoreductase [Bellilinea sp.]